MKKILLILVGGTICTALNERGNLSVSDKAGSLLKDYFEKSDSVYADRVQIDLSENLFVLSENMTVDTWNLMIDTYRRYSRQDHYDGIIFAHGTDTLAYSAALFSVILSNSKIPVFFVSANERLESERSNGNANFRCAVECICRGINPNVYVTYKNLSDGRMYLHTASHLRQCENYSEDFYSTKAVDITDISQENYEKYFEEIAQLYAGECGRYPIDVYGDWKLRQCVLMIEPYVGIDYKAFNYSGFDAVLHGTFHSGTACCQKSSYHSCYDSNSILYMLDCCLGAKRPVDVYISPSIQKKGTYETVSIIGEHAVLGRQAKFLYGDTKELAYAKLVIAYSLFEDEEERKIFIEK